MDINEARRLVRETPRGFGSALCANAWSAATVLEARVAELEAEKVDERKYLETVIRDGQGSATRVAQLERHAGRLEATIDRAGFAREHRPPDQSGEGGS